MSSGLGLVGPRGLRTVGLCSVLGGAARYVPLLQSLGGPRVAHTVSLSAELICNV